MKIGMLRYPTLSTLSPRNNLQWQLILIQPVSAVQSLYRNDVTFYSCVEFSVPRFKMSIASYPNIDSITTLCMVRENQSLVRNEVPDIQEPFLPCPGTR
jgi:hypothetical protein